jgi:hypothetical protein
MLSSLPITAVPLLILLPAWGCGAEPGTDKVLAHFDFEEAGWSAHSVLSEEAPRAGTRAFMLEGGFNGSNAYSPLLLRGDADVIDLSWFVRIEALRSPRVQLMLLGYVDRPAAHPAIPDAPEHQASASIEKYTESLEAWTPQQASVNVGRVMPEADWIRIEVRFFAPKIRGEDIQGGRIFLDDVVVTGRRKG